MTRPIVSLTRLSQERLIEAFTGYRESFDLVQQALVAAHDPRLPSHVFGIQRMTLPEVELVDSRIARLEARRRAWRTSLHAVAELLALGIDEDPVEEVLPVDADPTDMDALIHTLDEDDTLGAEGHARLDAFIHLVHFARAGDAVYLNGTFRPSQPDDEP